MSDSARLLCRPGRYCDNVRLAFPALVIALLACPAAAGAQVRSDFNGDGYADLAVGAPADSVSGHDSAGAVNVLYGSSNGLRVEGDQQLTQDTPGVAAFASTGDRFGAALAAGDLDGDGVADLVVGVPGEDVLGRANAGVVNVLYGSPGGLTAERNHFFSQGSAGVPGAVEAQDAFGRAVAVGDFDGDGLGDVAVGAPREWVGGARVAGAVNVLYGSRGTSSGIRTVGGSMRAAATSTSSAMRSRRAMLTPTATPSSRSAFRGSASGAAPGRAP